MVNKPKDLGIRECPNKHRYNANKHRDICPICGAKWLDPNKTVEEYVQELILTPDKYVCGWLVCVEGVNKGRAYEIKPGKNFVGSDPNMDVCIQGDPKVMKRNHSVIMYDPQGRKMMLLAMDSMGMVYIKDKAVYEATELDAGGKINMGLSKFMFVPLCGEMFDWEDLDS